MSVFLTPRQVIDAVNDFMENSTIVAEWFSPDGVPHRADGSQILSPELTKLEKESVINSLEQKNPDFTPPTNS